MLAKLWLFIGGILFFVLIAIPITHLCFFLLIALITQDIMLLKGIIFLPISLFVGFIPAIIVAISAEQIRQNAENQLNYLMWVISITLFIVTPLVLGLFYHPLDYITPLLLILSAILATLLTSHLWWKLTSRWPLDKEK